MSYTIQPVHSLASEKGGSGAALPKVSSSDNGKALIVKKGKWAAVKLSSPKLAKVATSGSYEDLKNVPDLSNFVSSSEVTNMINNAVGDITSFDTQVVQELPAEGVKGTIYFLVNPDSQESGNAAEEYIWVNDAWEKIGDTAIDLSPYVTWNNIGAAAESNDYNDLDNLPSIPVVPMGLSEFDNDAGFITADDLPDVPENLSELNNDVGFITEADLPILPEHNILSYNGGTSSPAEAGDFSYYLLSTDLADGATHTYQVPAYVREPMAKWQMTTKGYVDDAIADADYVPIEQYNKLLKAVDALIAEQGKGARSADGEFYETAIDAIDAAEPGVPMEVALTKDEDDGAAFLLMAADGDVEKDITFDLNGHDYVATQAGGSPGTQTQAVHLEKDNTVVIKGGSLSGAASNPAIKMLIQNYSNLTLEDMVIDCSDNANIQYVVSNNFGNCLIKNCTITAPSTGVAVDCWFGLLNSGLYDDGVTVTIEDSVINGNIEYGAQRQSLSRPGNEEWWEKAQLTITNSIINGQIVNSGAGANNQHHIVIDGVRYEGELPLALNLQ